MTDIIQTQIASLKLDLEAKNNEIASLKEKSGKIYQELYRLTHLPEANVFDELSKAVRSIENLLYQEVCDEPHGECGYDEYSCGFMVGDKKYMGTLEVEWNRYDKQFYYEDGTNFTYVEID